FARGNLPILRSAQREAGWRSRSPLNPIDFVSQITDVRNVPLIWPITRLDAANVDRSPRHTAALRRSRRIRPIDDIRSAPCTTGRTSTSSTGNAGQQGLGRNDAGATA